MKIDWFYLDSSQSTLGPLTEDDVKELIKSRKIERETLVWAETMEDKVPASSLPQFSNQFSATEGAVTMTEENYGGEAATESPSTISAKAPKADSEFDSVIADWLTEESADPKVSKRTEIAPPTVQPTTPPNLSEVSQKETKRCPMCAESIQKQAKICRFCKHDFTNDSGQNKAQPTVLGSGNIMFGLTCTIVVIVFTLIGNIFNSADNNSSNAEVAAPDAPVVNESTAVSDTPPVSESSTIFRKELFSECLRKSAIIAATPGKPSVELNTELTIIEGAIKSEREGQVFNIFKMIRDLNDESRLLEWRESNFSVAYNLEKDLAAKYLVRAVAGADEDKKELDRAVRVAEFANHRANGYVNFVPHESLSPEIDEQYRKYEMSRSVGKYGVYFKSGRPRIHRLITDALKQAGTAINSPANAVQ